MATEALALQLFCLTVRAKDRPAGRENWAHIYECGIALAAWVLLCIFMLQLHVEWWIMRRWR